MIGCIQEEDEERMSTSSGAEETRMYDLEQSVYEEAYNQPLKQILIEIGSQQDTEGHNGRETGIDNPIDGFDTDGTSMTERNMAWQEPAQTRGDPLLGELRSRTIAIGADTAEREEDRTILDFRPTKRRGVKRPRVICKRPRTRCRSCNFQGATHDWRLCPRTKCYRCGEYGHVKDWCPRKPPTAYIAPMQQHPELQEGRSLVANLASADREIDALTEQFQSMMKMII